MRDIEATHRVVSPAGESGLPHQRQAHDPGAAPGPPRARALDSGDATATVVLDGPYTLTNSGRILEHVSEALSHYGITQISLDMSRVTVLDFAAPHPSGRLPRLSRQGHRAVDRRRVDPRARRSAGVVPG